jgi:DNA-binding Xre family transcriptional regulator
MRKKSAIVSSTKVKNLRTLSGQSQGDLSMAAAARGWKITANVIGKIETGRAKEIDITTLFGLAEVFECNPADLVDVVEVE